MKRKLLFSTRVLSVLIVLFVSGCSFFNTYTVSYYANGADSGTVPSTITASSGDSVSVRGNTGSLTRENYSFAGWNTSYNGTGTAYDPQATFSMPEHDVQLYAQWTPDSTYTVTYHAPYADSGLVPVDSNNYLEGSTVTVLGNTGSLTKANYTFIGWSTAATETVGAYTAGTSFTIGTSDVDLYAVWAPIYLVTYHADSVLSGTVPMDSNNYLEGDTVTVQGNTGSLTKANYTFLGWSTFATATVASYTAGTTLTMGTSDVDLYAVWTADPTYTVTYYGNGADSGLVPADSNHYLNSSTVTVLGNTGSLARTGYTFIGWNTSAAGTGESYTADSTFSLGTENVGLYAVWTEDTTYSVTYYADTADSGAVPTDSNHYLEGATVTVRGNTENLTRTNYTFLGWNTSSSGTVATYTAGTTFTMETTDVDLYAVWAPTYSVTYHADTADSGSVPTDSNNYLEGTTVTVLGNTGDLIRANYTFLGWNTSSSGTVATYTAGTTLTMDTTDVDLYAVWTADSTYTVTYYGNGADSGSIPEDSNNYLNGSTFTVLGNTGSLARTGYTFIGWNTSAAGTGESYTADSTFSMGTENVGLYAVWTADETYSVTYHAESAVSGTVPTDSHDYLEGATVTVLGNTGSLIREGYALSGWNVSSEGTGTSYTAGSVFTMETSNVDLYAEWVFISPTIVISNPESPSFSLSPSSLTLQSGGGTTSQDITVSTGSDITIDSYTWIINGTSRGTDSSITLDTETHSSWFEIGRNTLTLIVEIDGLYYSDQFIFTVEQY